MTYIAKKNSKETGEYYWRNPVDGSVAFGRECYYPGWEAIPMWKVVDGKLVKVPAYSPIRTPSQILNELDPEDFNGAIGRVVLDVLNYLKSEENEPCQDR